MPTAARVVDPRDCHLPIEPHPLGSFFVAVVLVTGGTGTLGRQLVPKLQAHGHQVRILSRRAAPSQDENPRLLGDVRTGIGVAEAVAGADAVVHAASGSGRPQSTEIDGTRHVLEEAIGQGAHFIYVSIVGVDRHRFPYYKAKWAAEKLVEASSGKWSVQRATQFHTLIDLFLSKGYFVRTPNLAFQPVHPGEVADRLVELVESGPAGRASDFAGPERLSIRALAATRRDVTGNRTHLIPVPRSRWMRDFDQGLQCSPENGPGKVTWREWLLEQSGA